MDWIEQIFGIDPDFGSGSLEMLIIGAVVVMVAGVVISRRRKSAADEQVR
jgi:LPXTG-motif cell wall-anchored protein